MLVFCRPSFVFKSILISCSNCLYLQFFVGAKPSRVRILTLDGLAPIKLKDPDSNQLRPYEKLKIKTI